MKYLKTMGLLAVAAAALMAFAASASATTLTSAPGTTLPIGSTITAVHHGNHVSLTGPLGISVSCKSHVAGTLTSQGADPTTAKGTVTSLTFTDCTNGETVHVKQLGTLEVHTTTPGTNDGNGTITASGFTVEITNTPIGTCSYQTGNNLHIGHLTGSKNTKETATFHIKAAIPRHAGSAFCGSTGTWEGGYTVTTPMYLDVD